MKVKILTAMMVAAAAGAIALGGASSASAITIYPSKSACDTAAAKQYKFWTCEYNKFSSGWIITHAG